MAMILISGLLHMEHRLGLIDDLDLIPILCWLGFGLNLGHPEIQFFNSPV